MKASVIGAGSWGSGFAIHLGRLGIATRLWVREPEVLEELEKERQNSLFLPGVEFPDRVSFSADLEDVGRFGDILFIAVPAQFCRPIYTGLAPVVAARQIIVSLTKGIEEATLKRMTEVMTEVFGRRGRPALAVLSGPSFAREVVEGHPTAVVIASSDRRAGENVQRLVSSDSFRAYTSPDVVGVELAGAVKNVIALAAGISDALSFGHNSKAALITRGIVEIARLGARLGAREKTFYGLAGMGDLVLTCTSRESRNFHVGFELGRGRALAEILSSTRMVAEGVRTTVSVRNLARREGVEMPISEEVYRVLYENKDPRTSIRDLMRRTLKEE